MAGFATGVKQVLKKLKQIEKKAKNKALRKTLAEGCKPFAKKAKANCPVATEGLAKGQLKKSIGWRVRIYRHSGVGVGYVGPRTKFEIAAGTRKSGKNVGKTYYQIPTLIAHLVEYGTQHSQARPFLRPAFDAEKSRAADVQGKVFWNGIKAGLAG